jgi:5'-methylthioadenosine phosphorylase
MSEKVIGVIGGSGLYEMEGMTDINEVNVDTPFGSPSDALITGMLGDTKMVFLSRHSRGHRLLPSEINFRANIYAMKKLGVQHIISASAVGSMKEEIVPGDMVMPDQFIDRTKNRISTFFGNGLVGHVQFADPVCLDLNGIVYDAAVSEGIKSHKGGTYVCMEGPAFSTRAESRLYRSWGVSVIGMTNLPEAKLAREAEICYATIALATDYDCWYEEDVSVDAILEIIRKNVANAKRIIKATVERISTERTCGCKDALKFAVMTDPETVPEKTRSDLELIIGKYIK